MLVIGAIQSDDGIVHVALVTSRQTKPARRVIMIRIPMFPRRFARAPTGVDKSEHGYRVAEMPGEIKGSISRGHDGRRMIRHRSPLAYHIDEGGFGGDVQSRCRVLHRGVFENSSHSVGGFGAAVVFSRRG